MTVSAVLLADGPSDLPLGEHLAAMCLDHGVEVRMTAIDPRRFPLPDRTVEGRVRRLAELGVTYDLLFVHRDAEAEDPGRRRDEVLTGASAVGTTALVVPVVPVRMTEAWLLLDEAAIRRVAGRPNGRQPLVLPRARDVETVVDPKKLLGQALLAAGGVTGRRRDQFIRDFGRQRAQLLSLLERDGPITQVPSWRALLMDVGRAVRLLPD